MCGDCDYGSLNSLKYSWWRHQMETFSALLALCEGNPPVTDAELWCFLWSAPWINDWVNNREAGDFRCHRTHYDVIVMWDDIVQMISLSNVGCNQRWLHQIWTSAKRCISKGYPLRSCRVSAILSILPNVGLYFENTDNIYVFVSKLRGAWSVLLGNTKSICLNVFVSVWLYHMFFTINTRITFQLWLNETAYISVCH